MARLHASYSLGATGGPVCGSAWRWVAAVLGLAVVLLLLAQMLRSSTTPRGTTIHWPSTVLRIKRDIHNPQLPAVTEIRYNSITLCMGALVAHGCIIPLLHSLKGGNFCNIEHWYASDVMQLGITKQ